MKITVSGLRRAQVRNKRRIEALKPSGALGQAVQYATLQFHGHLVKKTHWITGALKASRRMTIDYRNARGTIFTSPTARNPRSGAFTAEYDVYEEARGGEHAAWARTDAEVGDKLRQHGIQIIREAMR